MQSRSLEGGERDESCANGDESADDVDWEQRHIACRGVGAGILEFVIDLLRAQRLHDVHV